MGTIKGTEMVFFPPKKRNTSVVSGVKRALVIRQSRMDSERKSKKLGGGWRASRYQQAFTEILKLASVV